MNECECKSCQEGKKFYDIIKKLPSDEDVKYMSNFYEVFLNHTEDKHWYEMKYQELCSFIKEKGLITSFMAWSNSERKKDA